MTDERRLTDIISQMQQAEVKLPTPQAEWEVAKGLVSTLIESGAPELLEALARSIRAQPMVPRRMSGAYVGNMLVVTRNEVKNAAKSDKEEYPDMKIAGDNTKITLTTGTRVPIHHKPVALSVMAYNGSSFTRTSPAAPFQQWPGASFTTESCSLLVAACYEQDTLSLSHQTYDSSDRGTYLRGSQDIKDLSSNKDEIDRVLGRLYSEHKASPTIAWEPWSPKLMVSLR